MLSKRLQRFLDSDKGDTKAPIVNTNQNSSNMAIISNNSTINATISTTMFDSNMRNTSTRINSMNSRMNILDRWNHQIIESTALSDNLKQYNHSNTKKLTWKDKLFNDLSSYSTIHQQSVDVSDNDKYLEDSDVILNESNATTINTSIDISELQTKPSNIFNNINASKSNLHNRSNKRLYDENATDGTNDVKQKVISIDLFHYNDRLVDEDEYIPCLNIPYNQNDSPLILHEITSSSVASNLPCDKDKQVNRYIARYLMNHQVDGIKWLWDKYALKQGGILGDDM